MSRIPLSMDTIRSYLGGGFRHCQEISDIHVEYDVDRNVAEVVAHIPASTTNQGSYEVSARMRADGTSVLGASCTCPIRYKCKHIHKVLCRVADSPRAPIGGPSKRYLAKIEKHQKCANKMEHASVYLALACKSELDSGSDFRRSMHYKDNFDQKTLGVFFSQANANQCAKEYVEEELGYELGEEDDEEEDFVWDGSDNGEFDHGIVFDKVWVERRAIEDASRKFRK